MMNSSPVMRAVVCAALVVLCIAGAGMFRARAVAEHESAPGVLHGAAALEQLKQTGQYDSLQAAMSNARLGVSRVAHSPVGRAAWHAPNAEAGYDAYVTETGVSLAVKDAAPVSLSLHSLGYGDELRAVAPGQVSGDGQAITIERPGLREWFVNGADGLEHGFTLDERPQSANRNSETPLRLALQLSAGWRASANDNGQSVSLHGANNQTVNYGKLAVRDSQGRTIPAKLTVADEQVVIEVADGDAQYPLTIDPLFTLQQRLLAADGAAFEHFGYAVALDGDTAVVGAPYDENSRGSAYVFVRNGATWTQQARLLGQDGAPQDYFGWSVALDGDTALVGTLYGPGSADADQGAAYVFVRNGTTWTEQKKLTANDGQAFAQLGAAVALDGDTALIGAPTYTSTPSFALIGAAYVFVRSGANWTQQKQLLANDGEDGDSFGVAVALEGDTALVGAPNNAVTVGGQGAAYVFTRSDASWTQQPRITTSIAAADANFGNAVALDGDKALIGAYKYGSDDRGAVFTLRRGVTGWGVTDTTFAPNPTAGAHFGVSVALSGDTAVIGASRGLFQPGADQRSAYVFGFSGEWNLVRQLGPELGSADDGFGYAVALSGDTALIGAYRGDAAATDQGAAYAFVLHDSRHVEQKKLTAHDGAAQDYFGEAVALSGDTLAVGADSANIGMNNDQGAVYVFTRSGTTWAFQQKLTANDGAAGDLFGRSVALADDTVVMGAPGDDIGGNASQGSAYVFTRSGTVWTFQQKLMASGTDGLPNDYFGNSVALDGNTVAVGAWGQDNQRGSVYVFTRNGTTWAEQQKFSGNDSAAGDNFGYAVALSGDTVAVGAYRDTVGMNVKQGSAYVFTRNGTVWAEQKKLTANDGAREDFFGVDVALNGDVLVAGAPGLTIGADVRQGSAYVFTRSGTNWTQRQKLTGDAAPSGNRYGFAVALSGDLLVVGAWGDASDKGAAYVYSFFGSWYRQQKITVSDGESFDYFGSAVALSGDTLAVGARGDKIGNNFQQGSAYVFVSPSCPAITIAPANLAGGVVGTAYNQPLTASGGSAGEYHFAVTSGALPPGVTVQGDVGLAGTPTTPGTYRFTITATYYLSLCPGSREYVITILPCPNTITVNPPSLPHGVVGAAYSQIVSATGGTGQHSLALTAGALPPGLNFNPNGLLSGTPTQAGSYNFTVTATSNGCTGMRAYTLAILATCPTLTVSPLALPNGNVGTAYSQAVTVTGGAAPYTFAITIGSTFPPGTFFNSLTGVLSGTPTQAGTYGFMTRIRDANNCEVSKGYSVTINPPCQPLTINPATLPTGTIGEAYNQTLTVSVSTFAVSFAVTAGALPPGLSLSADGNLSGTPTQTGNHNFTVTATANGCTGTRDYAMTISNGGGAPTGLQFYPLPFPVRLLDTRAGQPGCDAPGAKIPGQTSRTQTAAGRTCNGLTIPANAKALTGNIATVQSGGGYLTLYPSDAAQPLVANSNYGANEILNNVFTVGLGADGAFKIFVTSDTDVIVDVTGYYAPPSVDGLYFHPLSRPIRLLETRQGQPGCNATGVQVQGGFDQAQMATINCNNVTIPSSAKAIVGNATSLNSGDGYLTLYPQGASRPHVATSNFTAGQVMNAPFTVALGATGEFMIYSTTNTDMVIDVHGYYSDQLDDENGTGLLFYSLAAPTRLLETRAGQPGCHTTNAPLLAGSIRQQEARGTCGGQTIAATALAIVGNATVVTPSAGGWLTFWPAGAAQPLVASSNYTASQIFNRHFIVGLGATGLFNLYTHAQTDVVIDVSGFFAP